MSPTNKDGAHSHQRYVKRLDLTRCKVSIFLIVLAEVNSQASLEG